MKAKNRGHVVMVVAMAVTCGLRASDVYVWDFDRATVSAPSDSTFADDVVQPGNAVAVEKDGTGTLTFDLRAANQREELKLNVVEGDVRLSDSRPMPVASATPPEFLAAKAALWLKSTVNAVASGEGVTDWRDCRETSAESSSHYHAIPSNGNPVTLDADGKTFVYFNGYANYASGGGRSARFARPGSTTAEDITGVYHLFAIARIDDSMGHLFGTVSARPPFFAGSNTYFNPNLSNPIGLQGQYRLDGADCDLTAEPISKGRPLLIEWEAGVTRTASSPTRGLASVGGIFCERTLMGRWGGDYVGEYIVFTNRLTAAERVAIEDYLMSNWIEETKKPKGYTLKIADGSSAILDVSAGELAGGVPFGFVGGTLVKTGESAVRVRPRVDHLFDGSVRVEQGSLIAETRTIDYAFRPGEGVSASIDQRDVVTYSPLQAGVDSGVAKATGEGSYVVTRLADGISRLEVEGRKLVLAAPCATSLPAGIVSADAIEASIEDPSFEKSGYNSVNAPNESTYNGWTFSPKLRSGDGASNFFFKEPSASDWTTGFDYVPPRGSKVLVFRGCGEFSTVVNIPESGRYELTFKTCARFNCSGGEVKVSIAKDGGAATVVGKLHPYMTNGYRLQRLQLPEITEAGDYVLSFEQTHDQEHFACYSDFKVSRVVDREALSTVWIPNGDFEDTTFSTWSSSPPYDLSHVNGVAGWSLAQTAAALSKPAASPIAISMHGLFRASSSPAGNVQLMLVSEGAAAETTQSFTLPEGRWRLSYIAARWGMTDTDSTFLWNDKYIGLDPVIESWVEVDGQARSLGETAAISSAVFTRQYSNTLTIPAGGAQVKVRLVQKTPDGTYYAGALIDDVCFVRAAGQIEQVRNGSFESGTDCWSVDTQKNPDDPYRSKAVGFVLTSGNSSTDGAYGTATCDGMKCFCIGETALIAQDITFDEAGVHRLSFWTRGRTPANLADTYAGNQVRALLVRGATTNEIGRTESVYSTNFCQYARLFNVPSAGTWRLVLQGVNGLERDDGSRILTSRRGVDGKDQNVMVDAVSVRKAEVSETPAIPKTVSLYLSGDTKLDLDFPGTLQIDELYFNGRRATNPVNASAYPEHVTGMGSIEVTRRGLLINFR